MKTINNMETEETMNLHVLISQAAVFRRLEKMARKDLEGYSRAIDEYEDRIEERLKQPRQELQGLFAVVTDNATRLLDEGDYLAIHDNDKYTLTATVAKRNGTVICGARFDAKTLRSIDLAPKEKFDEAYAKCLAMQQELINSEQL